LLFVCQLLAVACGNDDSKDPTVFGAAGAGGAADEPSMQDPSLCHEGCVATLAAACKNGPADQNGCEGDCEALRAGVCGAEYRELQSCAVGESIVCSQQGLPTVPACADEQSAFVACINR